VARTTPDTRFETWHAADPQRTEKALLQLVPAEQQAFRAVYLDGLSLGEAAEELAVPVNTIKIRSGNALRAVSFLTRSAA
jgi:DNA-directed RNA polymerase specialized sigma24 family protein